MGSSTPDYPYRSTSSGTVPARAERLSPLCQRRVLLRVATLEPRQPSYARRQKTTTLQSRCLEDSQLNAH